MPDQRPYRPGMDITISRDDLSILLNIAVAARSRGHVSDSDTPALGAISRCSAALQSDPERE